MHISITDDLKKRFHATCALQGLKMSQVVNELIEQWLEKQHSSLNWLDKKQEAVVKSSTVVTAERIWEVAGQWEKRSFQAAYYNNFPCEDLRAIDNLWTKNSK